MRDQSFYLLICVFLSFMFSNSALSVEVGERDLKTKERIEALISIENRDKEIGFVSNTDDRTEAIKNELIYVLALCFVCVITMLIVLYSLRDKSHSSKELVSAAGITQIIFGTIILSVVVDTTEQLTAAIGILGAIAGYLFRTVQEPPSQVVGNEVAAVSSPSVNVIPDKE